MSDTIHNAIKEGRVPSRPILRNRCMGGLETAPP
jgi:hypothetical protein